MRWLPLCAAIFLAACSHGDGPSPAELKALWESQNVYPKSYKADLLAFMHTYLNDPTRVRNAAISEPGRKAMPGGNERFVACVRFNARDSGGRYQGDKSGAAIFVSGKLDRFVDTPKDATELCKDVAYSPFPELQQLTR